MRETMSSEELAWRIRRHGIEMTHVSHGSHIASVLSAAEIVAVLYNEVMHVGPELVDDEERDRFILSKGHASAAVYAALAEKGFFPVEELVTQEQDGSRISGHISRNGLPGVEFSTGSLGHGLGVGAGLALAAKEDGAQHRVFVVLGDGECEEGSVWEAALFAHHYSLANLVATVDHNHMQAMGTCEEVASLAPLGDKWRAFGWHVQEVNGNDIGELRQAYAHLSQEQPNCIIAHTVKGKGISFMENQLLWHYHDPQGEEYERAVAELEAHRP